MAFSGMTITKEGIKLLNNAQSNKSFCIKCVRVGDGFYEGDYKNVQSMINPLYDVSAVFHHEEDKLYIDADINNDDYSGHHLREIALIAIDADNNEIVYAYDNAGHDAELIASSSSFAYETRLRFCFTVTSDISVSVELSGSVYALAKDVENQFKYVNSQLSVTKQKNDILMQIVDKALFTISTTSLFEELEALNETNQSALIAEESEK